MALNAITEAVLRGVLKQSVARKAELSGLLDNVKSNERNLVSRLADTDSLIDDLNALLGPAPEVH